MLYHRGWFRAVDAAKSGLNASLLVKHPETGEIFVNFDPQIVELVQEAKCLQHLELEIPDSVRSLILKEEIIKANNISYVRLVLQESLFESYLH